MNKQRISNILSSIQMNPRDRKNLVNELAKGGSGGDGITIVDSIDKLDPNAKAGSIASVATEKNIQLLNIPSLPIAEWDEDGNVTFSDNLVKVNAIKVNVIKEMITEDYGPYIELFDFNTAYYLTIGSFGGNILFAYHKGGDDDNFNEYIYYDGTTDTINEDVLNNILDILAKGNFYFLYDSRDEEHDKSLMDKMYSLFELYSISGDNNAELFIKGDVWKPLSELIGGINDKTPIKETLTGEELVPLYDGKNKAVTVTELVKGGQEVIVIKHSELTKELFDKYIQEIFNSKIAYFNFDKTEAYHEDNSYPLGDICPVMLDVMLNGDGTLNTYMTNIGIYQQKNFYTLKYNGDEENLYKSKYYDVADIDIPSEILSRNFRDLTKSFPSPGKPFFIYDDSTNTGSHFAHCYDTENVKFWVTALNKYIFGYALFKGGNGYVRWSLDLTEDIFNTYDNNAAMFHIWEAHSSTFNANKYRNQLLIELIKYGVLTRFGRGLCTYYNNTLTLIIENKVKQYTINTETSAFTEALSIDINTLVGLEARIAALEAAQNPEEPTE